MSFDALLRAWNDARVIALDDDLLVVDKPSGIAVHGGDERLGDDVVTRLQRWLGERGQHDYLGVHQRLDKDASGVLFFTRRRAMNAEVAPMMESHSARRVYVAAVSDPGLPDKGVFEQRLAHEKGGRTRVVARGGQHARSRYRVLARKAGRALVELEPETGRTHQLRVQLSHSSAPIAGDRLYGGARASRLMLHARSIEIAGRRFEAAVPEELQAWFEGRAPALEPRARLIDAGVRRAPLLDADSFRLLNDLGDLVPGVVVDRYADFAVLSISGDEAYARRQEIAGLLVELGARGVYLKLRVRADLRRQHAGELAPPEPIAGEPAQSPLVVHEGELRFHVDPGDGLSTGLFVDQRDNRERVRQLSPKRMLNLFSYTCSFSVAAALGGARTTSVDLSGRSLERGRDNFMLNGLDPAAHRFDKDDVLDWLKRARRRTERFDLVVLDPPSFGTRGKRGTFSVDKSYVAVARDALSLLAPGGRLLAVTNYTKTSQGALRRMLHEAARQAGVELRQLKDLPSGLDCPDGPDGPAPSRSVLATSSQPPTRPRRNPPRGGSPPLEHPDAPRSARRGLAVARRGQSTSNPRRKKRKKKS